MQLVGRNNCLVKIHTPVSLAKGDSDEVLPLHKGELEGVVRLIGS